jgi:hypothetical protein
MVPGIVGAVFGLIPLMALLGVIFGVVGLGRARAVGVGKGMAIAGLVLRIVAVVLSIIGLVIVDEAISELDRITGAM